MICQKHGQQSTFCRFCDAEIIAEHERLERIRAAARDLLEAAKNALFKMETQECRHESIQRGGAIWTICKDCDMKWADDRGGFVPYKEAIEIKELRAAIAKATGEPS